MSNEYLKIIDKLKKFKNIIVSGPQRSGTTFISDCLGKDLNYKTIFEEEFGVHDVERFHSVLNLDEKKIIQCPALSYYLDNINKEDTMIVFCKRNSLDIIQSERRIAWNRDTYKLHDTLFSEQEYEKLKYLLKLKKENIECEIDFKQPINVIKYDFWYNYQSKVIKNKLELDYEDFHIYCPERWMEKDKRKHFSNRQISSTEKVDESRAYIPIQNIQDIRYLLDENNKLLKHSLSQKEDEIRSLNEIIEQQNEEIQKNEISTQRIKYEINENQLVFQECQKSLDKKRLIIQNQKKVIKDIKRENNSLSIKISRMNSHLVDVQNRIRKLKDEEDVRSKHLEDLNQKQKEQNDKINELVLEVKNYQIKLDELKKSLSFRIGKICVYPIECLGRMNSFMRQFFHFVKFVFSLLFVFFRTPFLIIRNINTQNLRVLLNALKHENPAQILSNLKRFLHRSKDDVVKNEHFEIVDSNINYIKPEVISAYGDDGFFVSHIEKLMLNMDQLILEGWAFSEYDIKSIDVYIEGEYFGCAKVGLRRDDVYNHYDKVNKSLYSGFELKQKHKQQNDENQTFRIRIRITNNIGGYEDVIKTIQICQPDFLIDSQHRKSFSNEYQKWCYRNRLTSKMKSFFKAEMKSFLFKPKFSIIIPVFNPPKDILIQTLESIENQIYENWELCIIDDGSQSNYVDELLRDFAQRDKRVKHFVNKQNLGTVATTNLGIKKSTGDYIVFMDHDDTLEKDTLCQICNYLQTNKNADVIYTDNDKINLHGIPISSQFKPDWSPELMYSYCYVVHLKIFSDRIVRIIGGMNDLMNGSQDYDYFLRAAEHTKEIHHLPLVLYHWREIPGQLSTSLKSIESGRKALQESFKRIGLLDYDIIQADFAKRSNNGIYKIVYKKSFSDKVSIMIANRNQHKLLEKCINSIEKYSTYKNYEIIVIDDDSYDENTLNFLNRISKKHVVIKHTRKNGEGFNFSKLNNKAAEKASGGFLIFLNADTEVISENWIEEMLLYCKMPEIGIVGARLLFPNNKIQHAGIVKGFYNGLACPAFKNYSKDDRGYMEYSYVSRNYSAVTAACLMIEKTLFFKVGGFDEENLAIAYNDVDLCLKVLENNYRVVYNPYVKLFHFEGSYRKSELSGNRNIDEEIFFINKWRNFIDKYYNINQSLKREDTFKEAFSINNRIRFFNMEKKKIRVLSVSHNLNLEGAPFSKLAIDKHLNRQQNIDLTVLSIDKGELLDVYHEQKIDVVILNKNWNNDYKTFVNFVRDISSYIKREGFDIVFSNTLETFWAIEAAHIANKPSVWNIRESVDYFEYFNNYNTNKKIKQVAKTTFLKANRNIFVCQATADLFKQYDYFLTSDVIYNGIDLVELRDLKNSNAENIKNELGVNNDKKKVTIIGTTCKRKGQIDLIKAALNIIKNRNEVEFYIVGARRGEYLSQLNNLAKGNHLIHIIDETPDAKKYYPISDIFVCASYNESFPRVVLEAMYFELPIITTPVFGISEQIVDGKSGLFYNPGDVNELKNKIEFLLDNKTTASKLGKTAFRVLKTTFTEQIMVNKYEKTIRTVAFEDINEI